MKALKGIKKLMTLEKNVQAHKIDANRMTKEMIWETLKKIDEIALKIMTGGIEKMKLEDGMKDQDHMNEEVKATKEDIIENMNLQKDIGQETNLVKETIKEIGIKERKMLGLDQDIDIALNMKKKKKKKEVQVGEIRVLETKGEITSKDLLLLKKNNIV